MDYIDQHTTNRKCVGMIQDIGAKATDIANKVRVLDYSKFNTRNFTKEEWLELQEVWDEYNSLYTEILSLFTDYIGQGRIFF